MVSVAVWRVGYMTWAIVREYEEYEYKSVIDVAVHGHTQHTGLLYNA